MSRSYVYDMARLTDTRLSVGSLPVRDTVELGGRPTMTVEARVRGLPALLRHGFARGGPFGR